MRLPTENEVIEFVQHSNRIEGEPTEPGHPHFDNHLEAAMRVRLRAEEHLSRFHPAPPRGLHQQIMAGQTEFFPGEYRQGNVYVGGAAKCAPYDVRPRMTDLLTKSRDVISVAHSTTASVLDRICWELHYEFESIHPFLDGNGRTGRLWMNALRLACGLPWVTVRYEERFSYYSNIRGWEALHR